MAIDVPVVACWVLLYDQRKFRILCCSVQDGSDAEESRECLKVCTNRSARPFDYGWYGETSILSRIPHTQQTETGDRCL